MKTIKRITKREYDALGGLANPCLFTKTTAAGRRTWHRDFSVPSNTGSK